MKIRNFDMFGVRAYVCMAPAALLGEDFAADGNGQGLAALKIADADAFNRKLLRGFCQKARGRLYFQVDGDGSLYLGKCVGGSYEDLWEDKPGVEEHKTQMRYATWYDTSDMAIAAMKMEGIVSFEPVHDAVRAFLENGRVKRLKQLGRKLSGEGTGSSV
jgi:hypothetical protein